MDDIEVYRPLTLALVLREMGTINSWSRINTRYGIQGALLQGKI